MARDAFSMCKMSAGDKKEMHDRLEVRIIVTGGREEPYLMDGMVRVVVMLGETFENG
jgi:hypothetical protein